MRKGFTLIELLVVIALIGILAAGIGLSIGGGGDRGAALQGGQASLNSLLSGTRAQAALSQGDACLFVNVTAPNSGSGLPAGFLREFRIAKKVNGAWIVSGDGVMLPNGVALVPPSEFSTGVEFAESGFIYSSAFGDADGSTLYIADGVQLEGSYRPVATFNSRGTMATTPGAGTRIVLSAYNVTINGAQIPSLSFFNPDLVRGAELSRYGVAVLVNEKEGFSN